MSVTKLKLEPNPSAPPSDMAPTEAALWLRLQSEYSLEDAGAVVLLELLCRSLQLSRECREAVEKAGKMMPNGREHPLLRVRRDADKAAQNALRALNLDLEPLNLRPGRPPYIA